MRRWIPAAGLLTVLIIIGAGWWMMMGSASAQVDMTATPSLIAPPVINVPLALPPGRYAVLPLDGQQITGSSAVEIDEQRWSFDYWQQLPITPGVPSSTPVLELTTQPSQPSPSATTVPTVAPPVATSTPLYGTPGTPPPTWTPSPTAIGTPEPTPTQEQKCFGTVIEGPLRVRSSPTTASLANVLGTVPAGDILALEGRTADGDWYVVYWQPGVTGYVWANLIGIAPDANCDWLPVVSRTSPGVFVTVGANRDELIAFGEQVKAAGRQPAATVYCEPEAARVLAGAGWLIGLRPCLPDAPDLSLPPEASARQRVDQSLANVGSTPYDYLVLTNEVVWPSLEYARDWTLAAVTYADALQVRIVPCVWGTGNFNQDVLEVLWPALVAMRDGGHRLGFNIYPFEEGVRLAAITSYTKWTTWGYRQWIHDLPAGLETWVAETAASWGNVPPDFDDIARHWRLVDDQLDVVCYWYDGVPLTNWAPANLRGQLGTLASVLP